jgi:hypothetical protein
MLVILVGLGVSSSFAEDIDKDRGTGLGTWTLEGSIFANGLTLVAY